MATQLKKYSMLTEKEIKEIEGQSLLAYPVARNASGKDANMWERVAYIKGATEERERAKVMVEAFQKARNELYDNPIWIKAKARPFDLKNAIADHLKEIDKALSTYNNKT